MTSVRINKHENVTQTASYEVSFPDGCPSVYRYFDDNPGRRSIARNMMSEEALQAAKTLARTEQNKHDSQ